MEDKQKGSLHPLTLIMNEAVSIFKDLGFVVEVGPELEDEWHNFDALNVPQDHPARDMQDTFFIKGKEDMVLRTHTSNTQIRFMENLVKKGGKPPFAIVSPGKVFRNEATDATQFRIFLTGKNNFRKKINPEYKANRKDMPEDLAVQLPYFFELFEAMGIPVLKQPGMEADDIIGSMVTTLASDDLQCFIVSGDKDFMQLVSPNKP